MASTLFYVKANLLNHYDKRKLDKYKKKVVRIKALRLVKIKKGIL